MINPEQMSDLDRLRLEEQAALLRWNEAAARVRAGKTSDEWRDELPEVRSFGFATDAEVEAETRRMEGIRPSDLAGVLRGRFTCPADFLLLDDELREIDKKIDGHLGQDATAIARHVELCRRRRDVLWMRRLAAEKTLESYLAYLRNRGASPERVSRYIEDQVSAQTAAEQAAWRDARDRLAAGEREYEERAVKEARSSFTKPAW